MKAGSAVNHLSKAGAHLRRFFEEAGIDPETVRVQVGFVKGHDLNSFEGALKTWTGKDSVKRLFGPDHPTTVESHGVLFIGVRSDRARERS